MTKNTLTIFLAGVFLIGGAVLLSKHTPKALQNLEPITSTSTEQVTPISEAVLPYGPVTLRVGETAKFKNYSITLLKISDDSRCPEGVTCIWAGTVKAEIRSVSAMGTSTQVIELGKSATTESEKISFTSAAPYPQQGGTISQSAYRATFDVSSRTTVTQGSCYVGGCSGEACSDKPNVASNCIYKPEFACYKNAKCERQTNGACGWTDTQALRICVANQSSL